MSKKISEKIFKKVLVENHLIAEADLYKMVKFSEELSKPLKEVLIQHEYFTLEEFALIEKIASAKQKDFLLGERYELLGKIGQGGMGHVFKAKDIQNNEIVAIKILDRQLAEDPDFIARFQREASFASKLQHPNIVTTLDTGQDGKSYYLVMEYVDGIPLSKILEQEQELDNSEALDMVGQLALALNHLHQKRYIHRDIKPDNILVLPNGQVKLIDMGLVRSTECSSLTMTGSVLGTPHYLSPEQALGEKDIDIRADIYSLGATLFHMVTGRTPFIGQNPLEVINHHVNSPLQNPREINPEIPKSIANLILGMMKKDKSRRFQNMETVSQKIEGIRQKSKSFLLRLQVTRAYQPTKYFQNTTPQAEYAMSRKSLLLLICFLGIFSAGGSFLWGFVIRKQFFGEPIPTQELLAKKTFKEATNTLKIGKLESSFFLYQELFLKYSTSQIFSEQQDQIFKNVDQLVHGIMGNLEDVELQKILYFEGELKKTPTNKYQIFYSFQKKQSLKDWKSRELFGTERERSISTLEEKISLLQWKINFSKIRQVTFEFVPRSNSVLGITLGNVHLLFKGKSSKLFLWQGAFQLPKSKFETVGGSLSPKICQQDCNFVPNVPGILTLRIKEIKKGENIRYRIVAKLKDSPSPLIFTVPSIKGWGKGLSVFLRVSPNMELKQWNLEGDFNPSWIEALLKEVIKKWKKPFIF